MSINAPSDPVYRWFIWDYKQERTATGEKIVVRTRELCHLYMRWSLRKPWIHRVPRTRRGLTTLTDFYYCFTVYHDNEQEEAGDTKVHTFIKEPWPYCEHRWFYFWGTVKGFFSPSTSFLYDKHPIAPPPPEYGPPETKYFYPDAHPEISSVDGTAGVNGPSQSWSAMHAAPGNFAEDSFDYIQLRMRNLACENCWFNLYRVPILFDLSEIPPGSKIDAASLRLYLRSKDQTEWDTTIAVFASNPGSNIAVTAADYQCLGSTPLSNLIHTRDIPEHSFFTLTLNDAGLEQVNPGGITKLGIREATYDAPNIAPWYKWYWLEFIAIISSAEHGIGDCPRLEVTYRPLLP